MANVEIVDWNELTPPAKTTDVIFVRAKDCPVRLVPLAQILKYESVYDDATRRTRPAKLGEKATIKYLFHGVSPDGKVSIYSVGQQIGLGIRAAIMNGRALGRRVVGVKVTASGNGKDTRYTVEIDGELCSKADKDAAFTTLPEGIRSLESARDFCLGLSQPAPVLGAVMAADGPKW